MKYFPRVFQSLRPYWGPAAVAVVITGALVALLVPWPLQVLVDNVLGGDPLHPRLAAAPGFLAADKFRLMVAVVAGGFLAVLLQDVLNVVGNYYSVKIGQNVVLDFRGDLFQHARRLSLALHGRKRPGMLTYAVSFRYGQLHDTQAGPREGRDPEPGGEGVGGAAAACELGAVP